MCDLNFIFNFSILKELSFLVLIIFYKVQDHITEFFFSFFNPEYLESVKVSSLKNLIVQSAK